MFQERCYDRDIDVNTNFLADNMTNNIDVDVNVDSNYNNQMISGGQMQPLVEAMQERCIHRTIMHEVPHVCLFMNDNYFIVIFLMDKIGC